MRNLYVTSPFSHPHLFWQHLYMIAFTCNREEKNDVLENGFWLMWEIRFLSLGIRGIYSGRRHFIRNLFSFLTVNLEIQEIVILVEAWRLLGTQEFWSHIFRELGLEEIVEIVTRIELIMLKVLPT